jgi:hypothetical protein
MKPSHVLGLAGLLLSLVSGCDNEVKTAGLLTFGLEVNSFRPCGHEEAWWVVAPDELMQRYAALEVPPGQSAYARLRGSGVTAATTGTWMPTATSLRSLRW